MENIELNKLLNRDEESNSIKQFLLDFEKNRNNLTTKKGMYIYGEPGTGKSTFVQNILKEMTEGINLAEKGFVLIDRKEAINFAVKMAKSGDCILLMGKGHESGQEVNGVVTPFDDRIELLNSIQQAAK
jgi:predicted ATPase